MQRQTQLQGPLGSALRNVIDNRLKTLDYHLLVQPFAQKMDGDGRWRGEFWGKIVRSACLAYRHNPDESLRRKLDSAVKELLATQDKDGCISSYPKSQQLTGWDLWGRKYVLLGLLRYYETVNPSRKVLASAVRMAKQLLAQIGQARVVDFGAHFGLPSGSLLRGLVKLHSLSGEKQFLNAAESIAADGCSHLHNVFQAAAQGVPPAELADGKAYEMTSCFDGLLSLIALKPNPMYQQAIMNYYQLVRDREIFITGGGGLKDANGEFWYEGTTRQTWNDVGALGETCVTVTWLRFCQHLLRATNDATIADEMERSFYNALLGAAKPDGTNFMHRNPTPLAGDSFRYPAKTQIEGYGDHDCCLAQGPEGLALAPGFVARRDGDALVFDGYEDSLVNFITPGGQQATWSIRGGYPVNGEVTLTLTMGRAERFPVRLRIPGWAEGAEVACGRARREGVPGTYLTLQREWKDGAQVELSLPMKTRAVKAPGDSSHIAWMRGPLVLARDSRLGKLDAPCSGRLRQDEALPARPGFLLLRRVNRESLCDYASAGNLFCPDNQLRVWLPLG
ncbi:MAG: glycoside hydrolase family 127 protein [Victivallales bacterium]|nr:glycoside hydrolase family 127 protein [Victivallales bacterium]